MVGIAVDRRLVGVGDNRAAVLSGPRHQLGVLAGRFLSADNVVESLVLEDRAGGL